MALITTADERLKQKSAIKGLIVGESGIGKTTLLTTLDAGKTLVIDYESGLLAVDGKDKQGKHIFSGDSINVFKFAQEANINAWELSRIIATVITGPDPSRKENAPYSKEYYKKACDFLGGPDVFQKYDTIFIDSITVAGRYCFDWAQREPECIAKNGNVDKRAAYGLHGQEMIAWATHLQHAHEKNIFMVAILDKKMDDYNRPYYTMQIEGSKAPLEFPGIFDQVITMAELQDEQNNKLRAFVCTKLNQWGYPAKDRSRQLDEVEEPHLGKLIAKIRQRG